MSVLVSHIELHNFRSYQSAVFAMSPRTTVVVGPNGSGKTNLLEAIYIMCRGTSFRDADTHLTKHGYDWWKISGDTVSGHREVRHHHDQTSFIINNKASRRLSPSGKLPTVLFEPDDLLLIHGSPSKRRQYIDQLIAATTPGYKSTVRRYERIVSQRNSLLKSHDRRDEDKIFVWDILLAEEAATIVAARRRTIDHWNDALSSLYSHIAGTPSLVRSAYHSGISATTTYKQALLTGLKHHYDRDYATGMTSLGPHRDDFEFFLDDVPFVTTASRGEIRSLVLALKADELAQLRQYHSVAPLLLLDDVFSELDATRQDNLLALAGESQTVITTTHALAGRGDSTITLK